jgi:hypothetical protein
MPDSYMYEVGRITDLDGCEVPFGVDYDAVTVDYHRFPLTAVPLLRAVIDTAAARAALYKETQ